MVALQISPEIESLYGLGGQATKLQFFSLPVLKWPKVLRI